MQLRTIQAVARAIGLSILLTLAQPLTAGATASCRELFGGAPVVALSSTAFAQLKDVTNTILEKYPASEYFYLGLGRSPTGVIALLQVAQAPAGFLPLSMFRNHPEAKGLLNETGFGRYSNYGNALSPATQAKLFQYFDRILPTAAQLAGKKILLIDYSETGKSLVSAGAYLELYHKDRGLPRTVELLALKNQGKKPDSTAVGMSIITLKKDLAEAFEDQVFDDWAPFGRYHPSMDREAPRVNSAYPILMRELERRLSTPATP